MRVKCVKPFGMAAAGEVVDGLPDDAAVDPEHWVILPPDPPPVPAAPALPSVTPLKEG